MGRLLLTLAVASASLLSQGRGQSRAHELTAYLEVIDSVSVHLPEGTNRCFSSVFWPDGEKPVPGDLLSELRERGWGIYLPASPDDQGHLVVHLTELREVDGERTILAGYSICHFGERYVSWWAPFWSFRLRCQAEACHIIHVSDEDHGDGGRVDTEVLEAGSRQECGGPGRQMRWLPAD